MRNVYKLLETDNLAVMPESGTGAPLDGECLHARAQFLGSPCFAWPAAPGEYLLLQVFSCSEASQGSPLPPVLQVLKQHVGVEGHNPCKRAAAHLKLCQHLQDPVLEEMP